MPTRLPSSMTSSLKRGIWSCKQKTNVVVNSLSDTDVNLVVQNWKGDSL